MISIDFPCSVCQLQERENVIVDKRDCLVDQCFSNFNVPESAGDLVNTEILIPQV